MSDNSAETEFKIKEAARVLFQEKGFAATKTRDIAQAANINLALLNYYFKSKQKLYDLIMMETMQAFFGSILKILNDTNTSLEEKIELAVEYYIDLLSENANIPHFIMNNVRENPEGYLEKIGMLESIKESYFIQQFMEAAMAGKIPPVHPFQLMMNLIGLIVFPFLAQPMLRAGAGMSEAEFQALVTERKRLIPLWFKAMLTVQ